jgi:hypothetical protein
MAAATGDAPQLGFFSVEDPTFQREKSRASHDAL